MRAGAGHLNQTAKACAVAMDGKLLRANGADMDARQIMARYKKLGRHRAGRPRADIRDGDRTGVPPAAR